MHLALPEKSTFIEDQKKATASIVLDLDPGVVLGEKQVLGLTHLVSSAVEGLDMGDVTVVDSNGKQLSKNMSDPLALQTASMIDVQQKLIVLLQE